MSEFPLPNKETIMDWYVFVASLVQGLLEAMVLNVQTAILNVVATASGLFAIGFPVIVIWQDIRTTKMMREGPTNDKVYVETYILMPLMCGGCMWFFLVHFGLITFT